MSKTWDQIKEAANIAKGTDETLAAITVWSCAHGLVMLKLAGQMPDAVFGQDLEEQMISTIVAGLEAGAHQEAV
jgi:hypothetical protein